MSWLSRGSDSSAGGGANEIDSFLMGMSGDKDVEAMCKTRQPSKREREMQKWRMGTACCVSVGFVLSLFSLEWCVRKESVRGRMRRPTNHSEPQTRH